MASGDEVVITLPTGETAKMQAVWYEDGLQGVRFTNELLSDEVFGEWSKALNYSGSLPQDFSVECAGSRN